MTRLTILLAVLLPTLSVQGQPLPAQIDSIFAIWAKPDAPGAAVAVVHRDSIVHMQGYGIANLEYGAEITPETVFLVASVSKQFTAFAIAMLAMRGDISLDDDVRTYIPELHAFEPQITIRHLVHHTSGLRDEFGLLAMAGYRMDDVISKDTILNLLYRQRKLNFEPGEEYSYCNSGYTLLAEIVERVSGQSFREWTEENIFALLGMEDSHFRDDHTSVIPNRAQGYITSDSSFKSQTIAYSSVGASGLYTTAHDLTRWTRNFKTAQVGGREVLNQVLQRGVLNSGDTLDYAFGLAHSQYKGESLISHSGSHRGFRTYLAGLPDQDLAVVVLSNLEEFQPAEVGRQVVDLFLANDAERLPEYAGTYYSEELGSSYEVVLEGKALLMINRHGERIPLQETGQDAFSTNTWYMPVIKFTRSMGQVTGMEASSSRSLGVAFSRQ